jgi:predicted adenylyl cyclase CyaB
MVEVELKAVVPDWDEAVSRVEAAGGTLVFAGRLEDRHYDDASRALASRDHVLRVRIYRDDADARAELDWKGPTTDEGGFKHREEIGTPVADPVVLAAILERLGFIVTFAVDRAIRQYAFRGATVRFERYARMDPLVEVEGPPEHIENAIATIGIPRTDFSSARLAEFVRRYEGRTGTRAAISDSARSAPQPSAGAHD